MKLEPLTGMKHEAGFRNGCFCRFALDAGDPKRMRCIRTPVMGCPVHDKKTLIIDDPEQGGSEAGAYRDAGYADYDKFAPPPPPPTLPPFVHGRLGEAEPGRLFYIVCDGPNDITLTFQGLALRMDRATLTALWRAAADGLDHLDERGRSS
jgi:hypothetical protein